MSSRRARGWKPSGCEAQPERCGHGPNLGEMLLELAPGVVQRGKRRTRQLELPARLERHALAVALQADQVALVEDAFPRPVRPRSARNPVQHGVDAVAIVGRCRECIGPSRHPEPEFLVFGADPEFGGGFAAHGQIGRKVPHRADRPRIFLTRVGHAAPGDCVPRSVVGQGRRRAECLVEQPATTRVYFGSNCPRRAGARAT